MDLLRPTLKHTSAINTNKSWGSFKQKLAKISKLSVS